jgi:hypothetical protein
MPELGQQPIEMEQAEVLPQAVPTDTVIRSLNDAVDLRRLGTRSGVEHLALVEQLPSIPTHLEQAEMVARLLVRYWRILRRLRIASRVSISWVSLLGIDVFGAFLGSSRCLLEKVPAHPG